MLRWLFLLATIAISLWLTSPNPEQRGGQPGAGRELTSHLITVGHTQTPQELSSGQIVPNHLYTYRYLSTDYQIKLHYLLHKYTQMDQSLGEPAPEAAHNVSLQTRPVSAQPLLTNLIEHIMAEFNSQPPVLTVDPYYQYQASTGWVQLDLSKHDHYNLSYHHPKRDLSYNQKVQLVGYLKDKLYNFRVVVNGRVLPALTSNNTAATADASEPNPAPALSEARTGIDGRQSRQIMGDLVTNRLNNANSHCFRQDNQIHDRHLDTTNELGCVAYGGLWEQPCTSDSECPNDTQCNRLTGYCRAPTGLVNRSYKTFKPAY